jgi:hypothetical protein
MIQLSSGDSLLGGPAAARPSLGEIREASLESRRAPLLDDLRGQCLPDYTVQLSTVIPAILRGAEAEVRVLDQTPHSLCWDMDAMGYLFMGVATGLAAPVFGNGRIERWARAFFIANAAVDPLLGAVYFRFSFSHRWLLLGLPWAVTAPGAILCLALFFRARGSPSRSTLPVNPPS